MALHRSGDGDPTPSSTVSVTKQDLAALERDREALATLRREAFRLKLDVLFLQVDLDRCRRELELYRGW